MAVKQQKRQPWQYFHGLSLNALMRRAEIRFHGWYQIDDAGCWAWTGRRFPSGYGYLNIGSTGNIGAHRLSWRIFNGPIPEGLVVLHKCDNRYCVNPQHLSIGTQKDNLQDMIAKGRRVKVFKTECKNGHQYSKENTDMAQGYKICKRCRSDAQLRYKARNLLAVRKYQRERARKIRAEQIGGI